jgi:hypothetical protein
MSAGWIEAKGLKSNYLLRIPEMRRNGVIGKTGSAREAQDGRERS